MATVPAIARNRKRTTRCCSACVGTTVFRGVRYISWTGCVIIVYSSALSISLRLPQAGKSLPRIGIVTAVTKDAVTSDRTKHRM